MNRRGGNHLDNVVSGHAPLGGESARSVSLLWTGPRTASTEEAQTADEPDLLLDYLRSLGRRGGPRRPVEPLGPDIRTCTSCGRRVPVYLDPQGSWAWCSACGGHA